MPKRKRLCYVEDDVVSSLPIELWHEVFLRVGFFDLMVRKRNHQSLLMYT
jgi:hypothetical protein